MVADGHGRIERALGRVRHVANAGDGGKAIQIVNLLLNVHGHDAFGIDKRGHVQFNTYGKLRVG